MDYFIISNRVRKTKPFQYRIVWEYYNPPNYDNIMEELVGDIGRNVIEEIMRQEDEAFLER